MSYERQILSVYYGVYLFDDVHYGDVSNCGLLFPDWQDQKFHGGGRSIALLADSNTGKRPADRQTV
jgi:hypothetical protein